MTNKESGLKLGMNSDHTVFNHIILDSNLHHQFPVVSSFTLVWTHTYIALRR